jgi:hypothetical protein
MSIISTLRTRYRRFLYLMDWATIAITYAPTVSASLRLLDVRRWPSAASTENLQARSAFRALLRDALARYDVSFSDDDRAIDGIRRLFDVQQTAKTDHDELRRRLSAVKTRLALGLDGGVRIPPGQFDRFLDYMEADLDREKSELAALRRTRRHLKIVGSGE